MASHLIFSAGEGNVCANLNLEGPIKFINLVKYTYALNTLYNIVSYVKENTDNILITVVDDDQNIMYIFASKPRPRASMLSSRT